MKIKLQARRFINYFSGNFELENASQFAFSVSVSAAEWVLVACKMQIVGNSINKLKRIPFFNQPLNFSLKYEPSYVVVVETCFTSRTPLK